LVDGGGILEDGGAIRREIDAVLDHLDAKPYPPLTIISSRTILPKVKRPAGDVAYLSLKSLTRDETVRLMQRLLSQQDIVADEEQLSQLVNLADNHPYNCYRIVEELKASSVAIFLGNPSTFIDWKHRQSSEYLAKISFDEIECQVLGLLKILPTLDFQAIVNALGIDGHQLAESLLSLTEFHIVENSGDECSISPPLRIAVERDRRFTLSEDKRRKALSTLADSLALRLDEGTAPIALVDSAVLSAIETGKNTYASVFLLPSHYVWLAKRKYDRNQYRESIRLSQEALKSRNRLSDNAFVTACRFMCLSAARIGDSSTFEDGISRLKAAAKDNWSKSNVAFLYGFNERMKGHQPAAENYYKEANALSPGNYSTARELAAICLSRGNLQEAEQFARDAFRASGSNAYVLDILIAVLTRKLKGKAPGNPEVRDLMDMLERVGDEGGKSFYTTRRAELELVAGDKRQARIFAEAAIQRTSHVFEPRRIYAEILIEEGNFAKVSEVLAWMREKVNTAEPSERRTNYRAYLETLARYLAEVGKFEDAKDVYDDSSVFADDERTDAKKLIDYIQMAKRK
jgi:tetratricopeptide (TPR) repeat protein